MATGGSRRARNVLDLLNHLDRTIAATQLGVTMSSIALGFFGEPAVAGLIEPAINALAVIPAEWRERLSQTVGFIIAYLAITSVHIVVGELVPKSLALQRAEQTALWAAAPFRGFTLVFRPAIRALNIVGNWLARLIGVEPAAGHAMVQSADELVLAVDASRQAGLVGEAAVELIDRAFTFTELDVGQVMVPRTEAVAIPVDATLPEILRLATETTYTRFPVYEGDSDHIVGIVNIKKLLPLLYEPAAAVMANGAKDGRPFDVRNYLTEPLVIPETVPAPDALSRMRAARAQIAVVIDEYGGTAGIVTLEDLVEGLVGEIRDEGEMGEVEPIQEPDGSLLLDGLTTLVEAKEYYDLDLEQGEYDVETVGGYVFSALGRPAAVGDEVVAPDGRILRVEAMDGLRVARVRVLPARSQPVATRPE